MGRRKGIGLGTELWFADDSIVGTALIDGGGVLHLAAFPAAR